TARRLLRVPGRAAEAESRSRRPRAALPNAQPAVSSRLFLQRVTGRTCGQSRALVVFERRLPDPETTDCADCVSPRARGRVDESRSRRRQCVEAGPAGLARGSVLVE